MTEATPIKRCPICGKPADAKLRPFCSKRCADIDLNRWLSGVYAVPAVGSDEGEIAEPEPMPSRREECE